MGFERSTEVGDLDRIYAPSYHESVYGHYVATRERRGHVTAAGAQAFLALANTPIDHLLTLSQYDLETSRHLGMLGGTDEDAGDDAPADEGAPRPRIAPADEAELAAPGAQMEAAGLVEPQATTLLLTHDPTRLQTLLVKRLARLAGDDPLAFEARGRELAYLASVLIAAIAREGTTLTAEAARGAALATCNLGLELLEKRGADARIDKEPGLIRPFLVGWQALGRMPDRVVAALTRSLARPQWIQSLADLRSIGEACRKLRRRCPPPPV